MMSWRVSKTRLSLSLVLLTTMSGTVLAFFSPARCLRVGSNALPFLVHSWSKFSNLHRSFATKSDHSNISMASQELILDPLVVCGPSGVGKGTIIQDFMSRHDAKFSFTVSHTTRAPREGEEAGIHYHFVSDKEMQQLKRQDAFLESALVHGNWYGTSVQALKDVQSTGKRGLLDIDVQGVQRLKSQQQQLDDQNWSLLQPKYIFIAPPSLDVLESRLRSRGSESEETLQRRFNNAEAEVEYGLTQGNFDAIVVNDDLELALQDFERTVLNLYELQ